MKKNLLFFCFVFLFVNVFAQVNKTWNGANGANWNVAGNWLPSGVPGATDTVILSSTNYCNVNINPTIAAIRALGASNSNGLSNNTGVPKTITISSNPASSPILYVEAGSSFTLGTFLSTSGVSITTYGAAGTSNTAKVDGLMNLAYTSTWDLTGGTTAVTNVDVSATGTIYIPGPHTAASVFLNSTTSNLRFLSGSNLGWGRNGGAIPAADYQSGSTISVTNVSSTMPSFSNAANYSGLLIWNCPSQTISGLSAILLPTASYAMDSIRIVSTGSGTVRLATEPNGYSIGQLEVQGGTLEMGSPITQNGTATINTDLKITGGTLIGNATVIGEAGFAYAITLTVNGYVTVAGGTFNLTNRPIALAPAGAFQLLANSDVAQTAGLITASSAFGSQNQINMQATAPQNLELDNITGPVGVYITNTFGVSLANNMTLPSALVLFSGYLKLNNKNASVTYPALVRIAGKVVTNGTGVVTVMSMPASSSLLFPVAPDAASYNPVTIAPQAGAVSNDYNVRVETGNTPGGIYNATRTVNRTWTITSTTNINGGTVNLTFQYATADINASCIATANMELGHFIPVGPGSWNIDPAGSVVPAGGNPYTAGTYAPGSLGSSFVLGNVGAILAFDKLIDLSAQKQLNKTHLIWTISNTINIKSTEVQRSADGRNFTTLASVGTATNTFDDDKLLSGINYYRIKITDANDKVTYSTIVAALNKETGFEIVGLMPNIVTNDAVLNVTAAQKTKMDVLVTDISGRQVQKISYNLVAGSNQFTINLAKLSAGTYQITGYTTDGVSRTIRFVKQ